MADILDQSEIDKLQQRLNSLSSLKEDAESAKEKIAIMYYEVCRSPMRSALDTLVEIGDVINDIERNIKPDSKYSESFYRLRNAYIKRFR